MVFNSIVHPIIAEYFFCVGLCGRQEIKMGRFVSAGKITTFVIESGDLIYIISA